MKLKSIKCALLLTLVSNLFFVQAQTLSLEDIFLKNKYLEKRPENLRFMQDDRYYTVQEGSSILKKETISGKTISTIIPKIDTIKGEKFDLFDYSFSSDEKQILLTGNRKGIYRRSFTADYVLVRSSKFVVPSSTTNSEQEAINNVSYATFSPDGSKIGFVKDNNLFYYNIKTKQTIQVTFDGKRNFIINGSTDWVYEEEFEFTKAFFWSADSRYLAFYRFDESEVPEYNMQKWQGLYPTDYRFKYPKAGEKNSKVEIKVIDLANNQTTSVPLDTVNSYYIPRIDFLGNVLIIRSLDRKQNQLTYQLYDPQKNIVNAFYAEKNYPIEINSDLFQVGSNILTISEKVGIDKNLISLNPFNSVCSNCEKQWTVPFLEELIYTDTTNKWIYFTSSENAIDKKVGKISKINNSYINLSEKVGKNEIQVSEAGNFYIITNSSAGKPALVTLYDSKTRKPIRILEDNAILKTALNNLSIQDQTFFKFSTSENVSLNGWMIKPKDFDTTKKYPVIMFEYGGPGSQMVLNAWGGNNFMWHQFLAFNGFIVACVDGRGTGGRGNTFRTSTYNRLGELETKDQIEAAKYLGNLNFVDKNRIGIWGWSFGGYLSTLSLLLGNDVFKAAIAVAPVTNWRFYDTIYTERYLSTPQDNAKGYDTNSPIQYADRLKGKYLLIHGTSDDNVHFQNAIAMQEALIRAGKQFETFVYPNKAHGISGGNTRLHLYTLMFNFWKEKLK